MTDQQCLAIVAAIFRSTGADYCETPQRAFENAIWYLRTAKTVDISSLPPIKSGSLIDFLQRAIERIKEVEKEDADEARRS